MFVTSIGLLFINFIKNNVEVSQFSINMPNQLEKIAIL